MSTLSNRQGGILLNQVPVSRGLNSAATTDEAFTEAIEALSSNLKEGDEVADEL